jgi:hypothetical protein
VSEGARGLRAFVVHLAIYFVATIALIFANVALAPGNLWVIWPLLLWGVVVAFHAARVMGLVPGRRNG